MSCPNNYKRVFGRTESSSGQMNNMNRGNQHFQSNSSAIRSHSLPRTPMIYSQHVISHQLPESEPMSEFSEPQMTQTRLSTPLHQMMPAQHQMVYQEVRAGPSNRPVTQSLSLTSPRSLPPPNSYHLSSPNFHLMPPPSPHTFIAHYNSDQAFATTSNSTVRFPAVESKRIQSSTLAKVNGGSGKTSQRPKISSVNRKRFFIGSIDQVVRWHKIAKEAQLYTIYEVSGVLRSVSKSAFGGVYKMILRNEQNNTLPLQAIFYPIDRDLPEIQIGGLITCVGRMVGTNKLQVYDLWPTTSDSTVGLKRISFLCQRTLQEAHLTAHEP